MRRDPADQTVRPGRAITEGPDGGSSLDQTTHGFSFRTADIRGTASETGGSGTRNQDIAMPPHSPSPDPRHRAAAPRRSGRIPRRRFSSSLGALLMTLGLVGSALVTWSAVTSSPAVA